MNPRCIFEDANLNITKQLHISCSSKDDDLDLGSEEVEEEVEEKVMKKPATSSAPEGCRSYSKMYYKSNGSFGIREKFGG